MAQMNHYTTPESEIALLEVKLFLTKRGLQPKNKVETLNQATIICAKLLTRLDEETLEQVL